MATTSNVNFKFRLAERWTSAVQETIASAEISNNANRETGGHVDVSGDPITTANYATNGTHSDGRRSAGSAGPERRTTHPGPYDCSAIKHRQRTADRPAGQQRLWRCCYAAMSMSLLL